MTDSKDTRDPGTAPVARSGPTVPAAASGSGIGTGNEIPVETSDRFPRWFGFIVVIVAFGFVGGWASVAGIDEAVVASGTVTVDTYRKTVQHLEGGIVRHIHVRDGDRVREGDLLVELDETQARASYLVNYRRHLGELARLARLEAELQGLDAVEFPEALLSARLTEGRAARVMATEKREFTTRREALDGEISVLRQRIGQLEERIAGLEAQRRARLSMMTSVREELDSVGKLVTRDLMPASELRPLERSMAEAEGQAGELRATIAATRIEIGETELRIIQLKRELEREVAASMRETIGNVDALEEELQALEVTLRRKRVLAPVSGTVVNLQVHGEWAVLSPGEVILDLVPEDEPLVVEARVRPQDIDSVTTGMLADVRFTAFSFRTTPVVEGEVVFVSADSLEDRQTGEPYFLTRIVVKEEQMAELGGVTLRPGMPAEVMIKTGERTPMQYLMKPLTDAIARSFTES